MNLRLHLMTMNVILITNVLAYLHNIQYRSMVTSIPTVEREHPTYVIMDKGLAMCGGWKVSRMKTYMKPSTSTVLDNSHQ